MKIICTQENLKNGLQIVSRIISSSNTLPILANVLIKSENGLLKISSTNLEIAIVTHVRCKVEEEGEITVLSKTLTDLISNLPNKNITLETKNGEMAVETENYHTVIKTLPAEEFPLIPAMENGQSLSLDAQELKKSLEQVIFAVSTNQTQPEIAGVLFRMEKNQLTVAATDRYRLAEKKLSLPQQPEGSDLIVPQKTLSELVRIIGGQKGNVEIVSAPSQIVFSFNDTQIISRLVDAQYPDYRQIIPDSFLTTVLLDKQDLAGALRAGAIFSQSSNSVKLDYNSDKQVLTLATESQDLGKSTVEVNCNISGDSGSVVLNHHYILDCLQNIEGEKLTLKIINDSAPTLIFPENSKDYIYLVMPIKS